MRQLLTGALAMTLVSISAAQTAKTVPQEILDRIADDYPDSLPRSMTPAEALMPQVQPDPLRATPPSGEVFTPPEYAFNAGMLVVWGHYNAMLTELAVATTTGDPEAMMWIIVTGSSQQNSATNTLIAAGADMSQVEFITYTTNTGWIRDYGPRFIFEDGVRGMIDHTYNRPRPLDDAFPNFLAGLWGEPEYDLPLVHGGGNFHCFANGDAFMSDLILEENPDLSEQDVIDYIDEYFNCNLTIYEGFPWSVDGTKHIDMWMLPVDDYVVIIGEYDEAGSYPPEEITDGAAADLIARGYTVYRTPGWNSGPDGEGGTHYTYTNATILNDLVFIPEYAGYPAENAAALAVFEEAFPDHQIIPVDCSDIIHSAGAIHCSMMHVPGYTTAMRVKPGFGLALSGPVGGPFEPGSIVYTLENASEDPIDYEVTNAASWVSITNGSGTIPAGETVDVTVFINDLAESLGIGVYDDTVEFTNLTDHDGDTTRPVQLVVGVAMPVHVFSMDADPGWSISGQWAFGQPTGQGGTQHGYPDPTGGATGDNVCGVNLNGDYSTNPGGPYYLTTAPLDCSELIQVELHFQRWLNTDYQPYVFATLEASADGSDWVMLWQNGGSEIVENSWSEHVYDISSIADNQPAVQVRWGYEVGSGAWAYSGWNIDDVALWGIDTGDECPADFDGDGDVDTADLLYLLAAWGTPDGDIDGDGDTDTADLLALLAAWGECP